MAFAWGGGGLVLDEAAIVRGCAISGNTTRWWWGLYLQQRGDPGKLSVYQHNRAQQPAPTAILIGPGGVRDGDGGGLVLDNLDPATITLRGLLLGSNRAERTTNPV